MAEEIPKTTQPTATSKIVTQAKEYVGAAVEKAQGILSPNTTPEKTPKTESPKTDEKPAVALEATASEIGRHTKAYAEAAQAAVVKQADDIKSKVAEVTTNKGESAQPEAEKKEDLKTKVGKAQDYLSSTTAPIFNKEGEKKEDIKTKVGKAQDYLSSNKGDSAQPEGEKKEDIKTKLGKAQDYLSSNKGESAQPEGEKKEDIKTKVGKAQDHLSSTTKPIFDEGVKKE